MILTLDPSLTCFGYAVMEEVAVIESGSINTVPANTTEERIFQIVDKICQLLDDYEITMIYTEIPVGSKSAKALQALSYCYGIVCTIAKVKNIPLLTRQARTVKKILCDDSNADKLVVQKAVEKILPNPPVVKTKAKTEAVYDAIAVYLSFL